MITDAYIRDSLGETNLVFVDDTLGELIVPLSSSPETYESIAPGSMDYLSRNEAKPPPKILKKQIQSIVDDLTRSTQDFLLESDAWYNGRPLQDINDLWLEFFYYQKWISEGETGPPPDSPRLDTESAAMVRYTPTLTDDRAKKRVCSELNRKRSRLMLEELDGSGNLVRYIPRQPPEINAQIFKYKRRTNQIYNSTSTNLEKIQQLYELKKNIESRHSNGRWRLATT